MSTEVAAKSWRGRFYEDFDVGDVFRSRFGRTVTEQDNLLFTALTHNTNSIHFDKVHSERTQFGQILVNSTFTLALITGMTVPDTSEKRGRKPRLDRHHPAEPGVRRRHTVRRERDPRQTRVESNPDVGIVEMRCRGINQRREVVVEYRRTFMIYKRTAPQAEQSFPGTAEEWRT